MKRRLVRGIACLALFTATGCQSALLTQQDMTWPSDSRLGELEVHSYSVINGTKNQVPFIAPIKNRADMRFLNEADATLTGVAENKFPTFSTPTNKETVVLNMESSGSTDLGEMVRRWVEIIQFEKGVDQRVNRGSISVDQVGYSIWVRAADNSWQRVNREQFRNQICPIFYFWHWLRSPSR